MNHYFIDLETLGVGITSSFFEISVVPFDPLVDSCGDPQSSLSKCKTFILPSVDKSTGIPYFGRTLDISTLLFWLLQKDTSRLNESLEMSLEQGLETLTEFRRFMETLLLEPCAFWSWPARFDLGILFNAFCQSSPESPLHIPAFGTAKFVCAKTLTGNRSSSEYVSFEGFNRHSSDHDCVKSIHVVQTYLGSNMSLLNESLCVWKPDSEGLFLYGSVD